MSENLAPLLVALNEVMKSVGYVQKDKKNAFHGYKYAGEEAVLEALRPALVKNGILLIPSMDGEVRIDEHGNTHLVAAYTMAHISGAVWPEKLRIPGAGNDKNKNGIGDKGTYKALTGANKYLLFKLFQIATGDDPEVANSVDGAADLPVTTPVVGATALKEMQRKLSGEIRACTDAGMLEGLLATSQEDLAELGGAFAAKYPDWAMALTDLIAAKRKEFNNGLTPGNFTTHDAISDPVRQAAPKPRKDFSL